MNIKIALCDDEPVEVTYLSGIVKKWASAAHVNVLISTFDSAESFLFKYDDDKSVDVLLLDIQMKQMDGVKLAHLIREDNEAVQIIFITGYPDFMAQGYDVSALHYLLKPVKEDRVFEVLDRALLRLCKTPRMIIFPRNGGNIKINADHIIYAEVLSHTVVLKLVSGKEQFYMRITDMEKLLGDGFFRCHRSYMVSMKYVKRVTKTAMILNDDSEIPLSRKLYDAANQAFINYN